MNKFKVGDKVEFLGTGRYDFGGNLGMSKRGDIFEISAVKKREEDNSAYSVVGAYIENRGNWSNMEKNFKLVKKGKPKKPTHIVVWDVKECGDPLELAYSLLEAKKMATRLLKNDTVEEESVRIYEIKKIIKPKISIRF